jgi:UDP-glucose 4-epimerase
MKIIWITGGKGFIGRYLARLISKQGNRVFGIGHGQWSQDEAEEWGYHSWMNADITQDNLTQLTQVSNLPDMVYHLAGGSSVGETFQNPQKDFYRTVESTSSLLEWLRIKAPNACVVCVSSAAVYGAGHTGHIVEDSAITPYSPYGSHKAIMETLCRSYAENFGLKVAIVRLFSVYGAGLGKQLIWDLCEKLYMSGNKTVILGGSGKELRDWLHVSDAASLLWLARDLCDETCSIINGGAGEGVSITKISKLVCESWGQGTCVKFSGVSRKGDPISLIADFTKLNQLNFKPEITLTQGIRKTVDWYKSKI